MFLIFLYNNNNKNKNRQSSWGSIKIQITDKRVIFVIYKELLQINKKKANKHICQIINIHKDEQLHR